MMGKSVLRQTGLVRNFGSLTNSDGKLFQSTLVLFFVFL